MVFLELKVVIAGGLTIHLLHLLNTNPGVLVDRRRYPPIRSSQLSMPSLGGQSMQTVIYGLGLNLPKAPMD